MMCYTFRGTVNSEVNARSYFGLVFTDSFEAATTALVAELDSTFKDETYIIESVTHTSYLDTAYCALIERHLSNEDATLSANTIVMDVTNGSSPMM